MKPSLIERLDNVDLLMPIPKGAKLVGETILYWPQEDLDKKKFGQFLQTLDRQEWFLAIDLIRDGFDYREMYERWKTSKYACESILWKWDKFNGLKIDEERFEKVSKTRVIQEKFSIEQEERELEKFVEEIKPRKKRTTKKKKEDVKIKPIKKEEVEPKKRHRRTKAQMMADKKIIKKKRRRS